MTAGYSGTALVNKLGIKPGFRVVFVQAPDDFPETLGALPDDLQIKKIVRSPLDLAVLFCSSRAELARRFPGVRDAMTVSGALWVAWPKKSSGVASDLDENVVRDVGLSEGLVDIKVCAIDETWSGLKFVRRLRDR